MRTVPITQLNMYLQNAFQAGERLKEEQESLLTTADAVDCSTRCEQIASTFRVLNRICGQASGPEAEVRALNRKVRSLNRHFKDFSKELSNLTSESGVREKLIDQCRVIIEIFDLHIFPETTRAKELLAGVLKQRTEAQASEGKHSTFEDLKSFSGRRDRFSRSGRFGPLYEKVREVLLLRFNILESLRGFIADCLSGEYGKEVKSDVEESAPAFWCSANIMKIILGITFFNDQSCDNEVFEDSPQFMALSKEVKEKCASLNEYVQLINSREGSELMVMINKAVAGAKFDVVDEALAETARFYHVYDLQPLFFSVLMSELRDVLELQARKEFVMPKNTNTRANQSIVEAHIVTSLFQGFMDTAIMGLFAIKNKKFKEKACLRVALALIRASEYESLAALMAHSEMSLSFFKVMVEEILKLDISRSRKSSLCFKIVSFRLENGESCKDLLLALHTQDDSNKILEQILGRLLLSSTNSDFALFVADCLDDEQLAHQVSLAILKAIVTKAVDASRIEPLLNAIGNKNLSSMFFTNYLSLICKSGLVGEHAFIANILKKVPLGLEYHYEFYMYISYLLSLDCFSMAKDLLRISEESQSPYPSSDSTTSVAEFFKGLCHSYPNRTFFSELLRNSSSYDSNVKFLVFPLVVDLMTSVNNRYFKLTLAKNFSVAARLFVEGYFAARELGEQDGYASFMSPILNNLSSLSQDSSLNDYSSNAFCVEVINLRAELEDEGESNA